MKKEEEEGKIYRGLQIISSKLVICINTLTNPEKKKDKMQLNGKFSILGNLQG